MSPEQGAYLAGVVISFALGCLVTMWAITRQDDDPGSYA